eukprot:2074623-Pyramimonas_sp.AAC.1
MAQGVCGGEPARGRPEAPAREIQSARKSETVKILMAAVPLLRASIDCLAQLRAERKAGVARMARWRSERSQCSVS